MGWGMTQATWWKSVSTRVVRNDTQPSKIGSVKKVRQSKTQMKCRYTQMHTACSNKQEELIATAQLENCNLIAVTETWWHESNDCSAASNGYKPFRRDRQGRKGMGNALCKKWNWLHREQQRTDWELMDEKQRLSQQRKICGLCLLQATQSRRGCWEEFFLQQQ